MKNIFLTAAALILACSNAFANRTADQLIGEYKDQAELGKQIAIEADMLDQGFGDFTVEIEMVLKDEHGNEIKRSQRNKTFEIIDPALGDKSMIIFDNPRDVKGTAFLTFSKVLEADDQWLYLPSLKRVKRISSKNKSGPFVGSEFAYEDLSSQEVGKYSYKYLRTEKCGEFECFVVERKPLYEYSGYTKQVAWIDTEHFRMIKTDFYDRKEELLKTLTANGYKLYIDKFWRADEFKMFNHQTGKSTEIVWKNYEFNTGLKESDFTTQNLKRAK